MDTRCFNQKKGFSFVEVLVIVAVIAILAAIIIPSFVGVDNKVTFESDLNDIDTMNSSIESWSALNKQEITDLGKLRALLAKNGYSNDSLMPKTPGCAYIWDKSEGAILMVALEDNTNLEISNLDKNIYNMDEIIYPKEYRTGVLNEGDWYFINQEPSEDNNFCEYPSIIGTARKLFAEELNVQIVSAGDTTEYKHNRSMCMATDVDKCVFEFGLDEDGNPKKYYRDGAVVYAYFDVNGELETDTGETIRGRKLGEIVLTGSFRIETYTGNKTVDGEPMTEDCMLLYDATGRIGDNYYYSIGAENPNIYLYGFQSEEGFDSIETIPNSPDVFINPSVWLESEKN